MPFNWLMFLRDPSTEAEVKVYLGDTQLLLKEDCLSLNLALGPCLSDNAILSFQINLNRSQI